MGRKPRRRIFVMAGGDDGPASDGPDSALARAEVALETGDDAGAAQALREHLALVPDDIAALTDLAHLEQRAGRNAEAIDLLSRALEKSLGDVGLLRSLIDLHLARGQTESALVRAEELATLEPGDVSVILAIAEIALQMGDRAKAVRAFEQLARRDDADGHRVYAYHGIVAAEIAEQRWRPAMDAAIDATSVDRHQLTTDLLVFVTAQLFGAEPGREPRPWQELDDELAAERAAHRAFHAAQAFA
ncbi:MAG: tetratricopeptide repeat protein [Acidimicrobiia bacterium]